MKKVYVEGYASNNLGDDLFFALLTKRYMNTKFSFNFADDSPILGSFNNVSIEHFKLKDIFTHISEFSIFIVIGGSMFQQIKGQKWLKKWFVLLLKVIIFKLFGKKIAFIGFNFGPFYSGFFYHCHIFLFKLVNFLSVRDQQTFNLLKNNKKIHLFPDIVFGLPTPDNKIKGRTLAISVMDFASNKVSQIEYENFLVEIINKIDPNIKITLYGFQVSSRADDSIVIERLINRIRRNVNSVYYNGYNMDDFLKDYYKNFFAITTRFHSLVLSLKAKQQIISIDYNLKVGSLLDNLNIKNIDIRPDDFVNSDLISKIIDDINKAQCVDNDYFSDNKLADIMSQSTNHFKFLDELLGY